SVLKRMKRGGGADIFLKSIEKMRRVIPDLTLRTSFIVGFPGETEKEFEELCNFVREAQFDWMGAFSYSDQDGARAYDLEKKLTITIWWQRSSDQCGDCFSNCNLTSSFYNS